MIDENKLKEQMFAMVEQIGDERLHIEAVVQLIDDAPSAQPECEDAWMPLPTPYREGGQDGTV